MSVAPTPTAPVVTAVAAGVAVLTLNLSLIHI